MSSQSGVAQFRRLLRSGKLIVAPGVYDAALKTLKDTGLPPETTANSPVRGFFNRFGANEWNKRRTVYRTQKKEEAAE